MNITYADNVTTGQGSQLKKLIEARQKEKLANRQVPLNTRANRRAADRAFARQQRKGKKKYMERAMLEQRVVNDLQHSFDVLDGRIAVSDSMLHRVDASVLRKQLLLAEERDITTDEAEIELRELAGR